MKKIILSIITLIVCTITYGQNDYKKLPSLGISFFFNDFQTASELRSKGLSNVIKDKDWSNTDRMIPGLSLSYIQGISNKFDFAATLSASFGEYPVPNKVSVTEQRLILEAVVTGNLKLLSDKYYIDPYITLGVGASKYKGYYAAFMPIGVGMQVKLTESVFFVANSQYRVPITENGAYHLYHSLGIVAPIKSRPEPKILPPPPPPPVLDRDGDGINDVDDKCPDTPGLASLQGCPDKDGDGIADADDACPDVPGLAKYKGCPIPDTDGDGINDELDKCPTEKGFARYQGCPIPDKDGDGVNDEEDKCPNRPGPVSNQGCPEISKEVREKLSMNAKNIFFATGSFKLLPKSFKSLDDIATILKSDELYKLQIDGHTDAQGDDAKNMTLSDNRAKAVKDYLISKGVSDAAVNSTGYGETKPVADNKTAAGRALNRRVEMTIRNF
jgi:OOP family OmpA-OmpF porin